MNIVIESGIPCPREIAPREPMRYRFPFDQMRVGDSFCVPSDAAVSVRVSATRRSKRGEVYRTRSDGAGIRIWRVA